MIVLTKEEAALALGWSLDRDWPMLGPDEHALQDRLRAVVETEPDPTCTADWCCTACRGTGWAGQDPCSDCYGTGHPHPTTEPQDPRVEDACRVMHDAYEAAAAQEGWETQERSRKPWEDVPEANKATMRASVGALLDYLDRSQP